MLVQHHFNVSSQQTRDVHPVLIQCWSSVFDAGPTLNQHWMKVLCLLGCVLEDCVLPGFSCCSKFKLKTYLKIQNEALFRHMSGEGRGFKSGEMSIIVSSCSFGLFYILFLNLNYYITIFLMLLLCTWCSHQPSKHETLNQCCVDVGPPSAQHQHNIGSMSRVCCKMSHSMWLIFISLHLMSLVRWNWTRVCETE